jgi:dienelactone hydrolase
MNSRGILVAACVLAGALAPAAQADMPGPDHSFAITREGDAGLPDHTILRPADLAAPGFKLPIVVWGNGGCRDSNEEYHYFLTRFASYGFFIIANGPPENPYHPEELGGIADPQPAKLVAAMDWAVKENARPDSRYHGRLDTNRIAVMGQSCGAWEGIDASADKRVKSTVAWNNGGDPHAGDLTKLHAPIAFVYGGTGDYTNAETISSYQRVTVPAVLADLAPAGHTGMWDDPTSPDQQTWQDEPLVVGAQWLALTLYGDEDARAFFLGANCGLCRRKDWTVESKNWDGFKPPPADKSEPSAPDAAPAPGPAACGARTVLVRPRHALRSAVVYVGGRRRARLRGRRAVRLRLRGSGVVTVRIVGRSAHGRRVVETHRYRVCS